MKARRKICPACGEEFSTTGANHKYCKPRCRDTRPRVHVIVCVECGKRFVHYTNSKTKAKLYCSPTCKTKNLSGEKHSQWQGGIASNHYQKYTKDKCERCGSIKFLVGHHVDRDRENNDPANIETLCRSCHAKEHNLADNINKV